MIPSEKWPNSGPFLHDQLISRLYVGWVEAAADIIAKLKPNNFYTTHSDITQT